MSTQVCAWCESEVMMGEQAEAGRPLTAEELAGGFLAVHAECRPKMDALFASFASKGGFVNISER